MRSWINKSLAAFAALALLSGAPAAAQVPDPFARELAHQLAQAETMVGQSGYERVAGPFAGGLPSRADRRFQLTLRAGQDYELIGVCDGRCRDIDMRIFDEKEFVVGADTLADDIPIIHIHPAITGLYSVQVVMNQCAAPTCFFAFNVYAR